MREVWRKHAFLAQIYVITHNRVVIDVDTPPYKSKQDCFLQKEAKVCVSNAFVLEDSMFK